MKKKIQTLVSFIEISLTLILYEKELIYYNIYSKKFNPPFL
jgi:hypothetical protein